MMRSSKLLSKVAVACERSAVSVSNHAKADHQKGQGHGMNRYENQTTTLTRSLTPLLTRVDPSEVEAIVFTNVEYAEKVETIYPYLWPALVANREKFLANMKGAGYG